MAINSKDKGARFERQIADYFRQEGYEAYRTAQYCGNTGNAPDVSGVPYIHIECKSYHDTEWADKWYEQATRDAAGTIPVVIHKTDRHKPKATLSAIDVVKMINACFTTGNENEGDVLVTMDIDAFMQIFRVYETFRYLEEQ